MKHHAQEVWDFFAADANWLGLHPADRQRFADFVVAACRADAPRPDFAEMLGDRVDEASRQEMADELADLYDFGCLVVRSADN